MTENVRSAQRFWRSDFSLLLLVALVTLLVHVVTNGRYGFHRDELDTIDNARRLAWGYVAYPPMTPFIARIGLTLFGLSLVGVRFFAALAQAVVIVLVGCMARELGGGRLAQMTAAVAVAIAPISLTGGVMLQYFSFDYLWWVLIAFAMIRLLKTNNPRWWLLIGAGIGLGMLTKYTIMVLVAGVVVGVFATPTRRYLRSPWLWGGVAVALLIFLPNLIWQIQHNFISLTFLSSIHARDIAWGRTKDFLPNQLYVSTSPITLPLWVAGLYFYFWAPAGRRFRALGWMFVTPLLLLWLAQGRDYYLGAAFPMLFAAGAVWGEGWVHRLQPRPARWVRATGVVLFVLGALVSALLVLPLAPVNSPVWNIANSVHDNFREMIGWPELVETVSGIYAKLPPEERAHTAIFTANYGEMGAIDLYGPAYGLPQAITGINSGWERGYGDPPPQTVIVLGYGLENASRIFKTCTVAGQVTNRFGVKNEETGAQPAILVCREPRQPWPVLWPQLRHFG